MSNNIVSFEIYIKLKNDFINYRQESEAIKKELIEENSILKSNIEKLKKNKNQFLTKFHFSLNFNNINNNNINNMNINLNESYKNNLKAKNEEILILKNEIIKKDKEINEMKLNLLMNNNNNNNNINNNNNNNNNLIYSKKILDNNNNNNLFKTKTEKNFLYQKNIIQKPIFEESFNSLDDSRLLLEKNIKEELNNLLDEKRNFIIKTMVNENFSFDILAKNNNINNNNIINTNKNIIINNNNNYFTNFNNNLEKMLNLIEKRKKEIENDKKFYEEIKQNFI